MARAAVPCGSPAPRTATSPPVRSRYARPIAASRGGPASIRDAGRVPSLPPFGALASSAGSTTSTPPPWAITRLRAAACCSGGTTMAPRTRGPSRHSTLRGPQGLIVLPLLQEPRAVPVDVDPPAEVALDQLLEGSPVLAQEEEKIGVVLAVKEGGLGKDIENSPHALELEPVHPQLAGIRRLRRSPLVSHGALRSGRSRIPGW